MNDELRERIEHAAEKHALLNAVKHGDSADVGAVIGPLMGDNPEFQEHGDEVPGIVAPVVGRVNELDAEGRQKRLEAVAPDLLTELETDDKGDDHALPDLSDAEEGDVRMRLAPNPNGPWHLGHARMPAVIGSYKDRYDGWMLCRFDDTDPETKRPDLEAYDAIIDAIEYLGFEPDEVVRASDRMETYYAYARELIEMGGAYTCSCPAEEFSELKNSGEACPHRDKSPETTREEFDAMVAGEYDAGEMVLRVRTNIDHKNPALRDWVAFRMVDTPHPREEASDYRCWPLLDFQSGVDDHRFEITHIIRGIDLQDSAKRQRFLYDYFGWEYPEVIHWGHVQLDAYDVKMSTSTIKRLIETGELDGWDDPRAPTIASLRRRGIRGDAITEAMVGLGTSTSNVDLAMSSVYAANRERIDDEADRAFFVRGVAEQRSAGSETESRHAVEKTVIDGPAVGEPPVHPNHEERGVREIPVEGGVLVEPDDVPPNGKRVWLKGYGCVRHTRDAFEFVGTDIEVVREEGVPVIHWVPADDNRNLRLRTMEGDVCGHAEPAIADRNADEMVQFERVGFARIDRQEADRTVAYFAHP